MGSKEQSINLVRISFVVDTTGGFGSSVCNKNS